MLKKNRFEGKLAVITGASSGIGKAASLEFAREGARTVLVSRSRDKLERVADEVLGLGGEALVVPADVSDARQVKEMVAQALKEFGRIDILFNNAGSSSVGRIDEQDFVPNTKKMMDVDYFGTVNVTIEVLPVMKRQGSGHIMNMSSVVGKKAFPHFGGYSSAMHAITAFSDALRQELHGTGINVSTIHPALTLTPLLEDVKPEDMPPPFKSFTPISVESVARAVVEGIVHNRARIVVPFQPKMVLLADAVSPGISDMIVRMLPNRTFSRLIGMYKGKSYHETLRE